MANINLLPWREQRRESQKREFMGMLGIGALGSVFLILIVHLAIASEISSQNYVNTYLQQVIQQVDKDIDQINKLKQERNEMIAKLKVIQSLQANRPLTVHVFDELPKLLPKGVYLTGVARVREVITLEGSAESNTRVSELMRNLEDSPWFEKTVLMEIKTDNNAGGLVNHFQIQTEESEDTRIPTEDWPIGTNPNTKNHPTAAQKNKPTSPAASNAQQNPQSTPSNPAAANTTRPTTAAAMPPKVTSARGGQQP